MKVRIVGHRMWTLWPWVLATVGGALLTVLALLLFYRTGGLAAVAPPVLLEGARLQLVSGQVRRRSATWV
jgi:hypothetical protein